jgi:hypothetical protein
MALDCGIAVLERTGATPGALAFVRELNGEGYMSAFQEKGHVDFVEVNYPARANDNSGYALVNGIPSVVRADDWTLLKPIHQEVLQSEIGRQHPQALLWTSHALFETLEPGPSGGQRFIFSYDLLDCHACPQLAFAFVAFDFDDTGRFLEPRLLSVASDYTAIVSTTPSSVKLVGWGLSTAMNSLSSLAGYDSVGDPPEARGKPCAVENPARLN